MDNSFNLSGTNNHIHLLGSCGTFMSGLAHLMEDAGINGSGSDQFFGEPLASILPQHFKEDLDSLSHTDRINTFVIANKFKRTDPIISRLMTTGKPFMSCMDLLAKFLTTKKVIAIAGTHGKTTTTSLVTWILECAGYNPSFLIGGLPKNFSKNARYTSSDYFVLEADEYDTAFFDKRSKFLHLWPDYLLLNTVEFDHGDIFAEFEDVERTFNYLLRRLSPQSIFITVEQPRFRMITSPDINPVCTNNQIAHLSVIDGVIFYRNSPIEAWPMLLGPNLKNISLAVSLAEHMNIDHHVIRQALNSFAGVYRRSEKLKRNDLTIWHDFGHHPTAIKETLECFDQGMPLKLWIEKGSNSMKNGLFDLELSLLEKKYGGDNVFFFDRNINHNSISEFMMLCKKTKTQGVMFSNHPKTWDMILQEFSLISSA